MLRIILIVFILNGCKSASINSTQAISKFEMAAIPTGIQTPISINEEDILNELYKIGYKEVVTDEVYLSKIQKEINNLVRATVSPKFKRSFLFSGLLFYQNQKETYVSFTAYKGKYYIYYDKELFEWNQDLANLIYERLPEEIMVTIYDDMK